MPISPLRSWLLAVLSTSSLLAQAPATSPPTPAPQAPESTEIFVADLVRSGEGWQVLRPRNVTRRPGYDNQPWFLPDGQRILYTSQREGQTDVYELDLATGSERQVTATPESEYSPQLAPDGAAIVVVRVEADTTQRLWRFPLAGGEPTVIAPEVKGVGYHAWIDQNTVAVFVLGEPITLQIVNIASRLPRFSTEKIGRSIHRIPGTQRVSFVASDGTAPAIFYYEPAARNMQRLVPAPGTPENDYAWTPDGYLLAARGAKLFRLLPSPDADWTEIADLSGEGIGTITRLAVSPFGDKLALVVDR